MDSADRSFLEYGLASGADRLVMTSSNLTNSDSCHDWTGDDPPAEHDRRHKNVKSKKEKVASCGVDCPAATTSHASGQFGDGRHKVQDDDDGGGGSIYAETQDVIPNMLLENF